MHLACSIVKSRLKLAVNNNLEQIQNITVTVCLHLFFLKETGVISEGFVFINHYKSDNFNGEMVNKF